MKRLEAPAQAATPEAKRLDDQEARLAREEDAGENQVGKGEACEQAEVSTITQRRERIAERRRYTNMMNAQPAAPTFREGDEVVLAKGSVSGHFGRFSPRELGHQLGGHQGTQWCHPQPPGDMAGSFRDPTFQKLTSP